MSVRQISSDYNASH